VTTSLLGDFLQARRAQVHPEDVGLPGSDHPRRVSGLRREELARLAAVSVDYYVRVEQGRAQHVSDSVLYAIADALNLDGIETRYLMRLAHDGEDHGPEAGPRPAPDLANPGLQRLIDTMTETPAIIVDRLLRVRATNALGAALFGFSADRPDDRRDLARRIFLDPGLRDRLLDWEDHARAVVALLRLKAGHRATDPEMACLVGLLSIESAAFRRLWAAHDVKDYGHSQMRLDHPRLGLVTLGHESLCPGAATGLAVHFFPAPDADTTERLRLLTG
jgi:transcriptional regulator with XRE-family HTH domain